MAFTRSSMIQSSINNGERHQEEKHQTEVGHSINIPLQKPLPSFYAS
jgi:hypothetical protein